MAIQATFDPGAGLLPAVGDGANTITTIRPFLGRTVMRKMPFDAVFLAAAGIPAVAGYFSRFRWVNAIQGEMSMHWLFANARRAATFVASGLLLCASSGWVNPAVAQTFRVDVSGTFTSGTPFAVSFLVNTNAAPVLHQNVQGLALTGYADAAISGFGGVNVEGLSFAQSDIQDRIALAGQPGAAVFFSQDLANGATPSIWMFLENLSGFLEVGDVACGFASGPPCQFLNQLEVRSQGFPNHVEDSGTETVSVQITGYAGTPGAKKCHGQSVNALSKQFGTLSAAADALGFASVTALQASITMFCGN